MASLSIITVCRNARYDLALTGESVLGQTANDFEWIIIDGDSTDGTQEYIRSLKAENISSVSETDNGIYDAMNKGLQMAGGEWVWFLNAGDCFYNKRTIEDVLRETEGVELVYGESMVMDAERNSLGLRSEVTPHRLPGKLQKKDFARGMVVSHQSFVVLKSMAPDYNAESFRLSADLDWMLRILGGTPVSRGLKFPLSRILREGATMRHWKRSQWERFLILGIHFGYLKSLLNHLAIIVRRFAHGFKTRFWR